MKAVSRITAVLGALAVAFALTSATAQAAPVDQQVVQSMIQDMAEANPGARQISPNTLVLANGVQASVSAAALCPYYNLCIYDGEYRSGYQWNLLRCGFVNIGNEGWSDRIRSFSNNQTPGTVSIFMNWTGSSWQELHRSRAYEAYDRAGFVHATDGIWVC